MEPPASKVSTSTRRFGPRFTLRVLLVFVTLIGIGLGIWTHRAREQHRVVEKIRMSGGYNYVYYHFEFDGTKRNPTARSPVPRWLIDFLGIDFFHRVRSVLVQDRGIVRELQCLSGLEAAHVLASGLTDEDADEIAKIRRLKDVALWPGGPWEFQEHTEMTDRSLQAIGKMPHIEKVWICGNGFTNRGLADLAKAATLREVTICSADRNLDATAVGVFRLSPHVEEAQIVYYSEADGQEVIGQWNRP